MSWARRFSSSSSQKDFRHHFVRIDISLELEPVIRFQVRFCQTKVATKQSSPFLTQSSNKLCLWMHFFSPLKTFCSSEFKFQTLINTFLLATLTSSLACVSLLFSGAPFDQETSWQQFVSHHVFKQKRTNSSKSKSKQTFNKNCKF